MKSKRLLSMILSLILLLGIGATAHAAPVESAPEAAASCGALLTVNSNNLQQYVRMVFTNSQPTLYSVKLEKLVGGVWQEHSTTGLIYTTDNPIIYDVPSNPPRGYYYRLYVDAASSGIPNFSFYSNTVYY